MKIEPFNFRMPLQIDGNPETTKADPTKPAVGPPGIDSFEIGRSFGFLFPQNTRAKEAALSRSYDAARNLSSQDEPEVIQDGAWKDYLGLGILVRDLRHQRWVTDTIGQLSRNAAKAADAGGEAAKTAGGLIDRALTPAGKLQLPIPRGITVDAKKAAAGLIDKTLTPAGKFDVPIPKGAAEAVADVVTPGARAAAEASIEAAPIAKIAAEAAPLTKAARVAGKVVGRAVPFVNAGLAVIDIVDAGKIVSDPKASTGKKVLGVATAVASTLSVVPGLGFFAGLGAAALGFARDAVK